MQSLIQKCLSFLTRKRNYYILLAIMTVFGTAAVIYATRWGAALNNDTYYYIKPAREILAGRAPVFNSHYPPLLPLLLTVIGFGGIDPLLGLRLLNAVCFGINSAMAGILVWRMTSSRGIALAGAFIFLTSQVMLEVHSWAMSEAIFITLSFVTLLAFSNYAQKRSWLWLVVTALLAGSASLSRYAGIGVIAAVGLVLLLLPYQSWWKRIQTAGIFGLISGGLFAVYIFGYSLALGEMTQFGGIQFRLLEDGPLREGAYNILLWFVSGRLVREREVISLLVLIILVILLIGAYWLLQKKAFNANKLTVKQQPLFVLVFVLLCTNLFLLYEAHLSPTYASPFDNRLLSPSHALLIVLIVACLGLVWKENGKIIKAGVLIAFVWILFLYIPRSVNYVSFLHEEGAGFAKPYWIKLDAARFINSHSDDQIITTAPIGVYFALGRELMGVRPFYAANALTPDELHTWMKDHNGYLIVFNSMPLEVNGASEEEFLAGLEPIDEYSDCTVYQLKP